ncbi:MAG: hypothetical protein ACLR6J_15380 [Parabacteroides merdae]
MQQNIDQLNTEMPAYSKVLLLPRLYQEEFEKTPKRSIKRCLYQPAEEASVNDKSRTFVFC